MRDPSTLDVDSTPRSGVRPAGAGVAGPEVPLGSWLLVALGLTILAGWVFDVPRLRSVLPGLATMKPVTATSFLSAGLALRLFHRGEGSPARHFLGGACAALVTLLGILALVDYHAAWGGGLLQGALLAPGADRVAALQMSEATGWGFTLSGLALLGLWLDVRWGWVQAASLAVATLAGTALNGYAYDIQALYSVGPFSSLALHTALGFMVLSGTTLLSRADRGLVALLRSPSAGGRIARRLLPLAVVVPFLLGWLSVNGTRQGLYEKDFAVAVLAAACTVLLGGLVWLYAMGQDRSDTARKRVEEELAGIRRLEAVGRTAGRVAHDFNNFLTVINTSASLALEGSEDEATRENLVTILGAGHRAADLTRQLLTFSRRRPQAPGSSTLNDVIRDVEPILRRLAPAGVDLTIELCEDPTGVGLDATQLTQVLTNLVVNACDAMPGGGALRMETSVTVLDEAYADQHIEVLPGRYVLLLVSDSGMGMDPETRAHVFEPFFTTKEVGKGSGLGLATVYGIVRQAHGYVWLYSEKGAGTTFKIFLPPSATTPVREAGGTKPARADPRGASVLVVDDDPVIRRAVGRALERSGFVVSIAEDGASALRAMEGAGRVDVLLSDVVMPGMSATELAAEVRRRDPEVRMIFMSGYAEEGLTDLGGVDFIEKPFDIEDLRRRVASVLTGADPGRTA